MTTQDCYAKLTQIFHDVFDDDSIVVTPELTANAVDDWDSLGHMRLILAVETAFGLGFSAAEVKRLQNVGEFVALIQSKAAA
jgi:acyl carrier protein